MSTSQNILTYLVFYSPRQLKRTDLVKLLYLVDWEYLSLYGRPATDIKWVRDYYGPYAHSIVNDLYQLQSQEQVSVAEISNSFGGVTYLHKSTEATQIPKLSYQLKAICDQILVLHGKLSLNEIKNIAYSTPPMKYALSQEQEEGYRAFGKPLELERFVPRRRRRVARSREVLSTQGDPSRRHSTTIAEYQKWEGSIKKSTNLVLGEGNTCDVVD